MATGSVQQRSSRFRLQLLRLVATNRGRRRRSETHCVFVYVKAKMGDEMIVIVIRHVGRMDFSGSEPRYVGGETSVVGFDTDYLSYRTLNAVAKKDLGILLFIVVMFFEAEREVSGGWDNEVGNLGDDEGFNSDDDVGAQMSVQLPLFVVSDDSGGEEVEQCNSSVFSVAGNSGNPNQVSEQVVEHSMSDLNLTPNSASTRYRQSGSDHVRPDFSHEGSYDAANYEPIQQVTMDFSNVRLRQAEAKEEFWNAVYSSNQVQYDKHANRLKQLQDDGTDRKVYDDFIKQEPKRFCRAFLSTAAKSDSVESNVCESFNNAITKFRDLRIIKLLEGIRTYIMVQMVEQHKAFAAMKDVICPTILEQIEWTKIGARTCIIQPSMDDVLQLELAKKAYIKGIPPLPGREDWADVEGLPVLPPPHKVMLGRPKKNRRKEPGEVPTRPSRMRVGTMMRKTGAVMHCSRCGQSDHNKRGSTRSDWDKHTTTRQIEIRQAMRGVAVHVSPETGNQYFARGAGVRLEEVDINPDVINQSQQPGTQPPNTQPQSSG
ncbi:hypothetical protein LINPERPRIM_LOCUS1299 [Linum perenne]